MSRSQRRRVTQNLRRCDHHRPSDDVRRPRVGVAEAVGGNGDRLLVQEREQLDAARRCHLVVIDRDIRVSADGLGERGSFNFLGTDNASAAASPLAFYKFYAGEEIWSTQGTFGSHGCFANSSA